MKLNNYLEYILIITLGFCIGFFGFTLLKGSQRGSFYQEFYDPAVSFACGYGFNSIPSVSPSYLEHNEINRSNADLREFLLRHTNTLSCSQLNLDSIDTSGKMTTMQYAMYFPMFLSGVVWSLLGISWSNLNIISGLYNAISALALYLLYKNVVSKKESLFLLGITLLSPVWLTQIINLRDFSKAPFILLLTAMASIVVVKSNSYKRVITFSVLMVLTTCFGLCFRGDTIVLIPIFILAILFANIDGCNQYYKIFLKILLLMFSLLVTSFFLTSQKNPINRNHLISTGHVILLGQTSYFADQNVIKYNKNYDVGHMYFDPFIASVVKGYAKFKGINDNLETYDKKYNNLAISYYIDLWKNFPFHNIVNVASSVVSIISLPVSSLQSFSYEILNFSPSIKNAFKMKIGALPQILLNFFFLVSVWSMHRKGHTRFASFFFLTSIYYSSILSLQFSYRHGFHLAYILILSIGFLFFVGYKKIKNKINYKNYFSISSSGAEKLKNSAFLRMCFICMFIFIVLGGLLKEYEKNRYNKLIFSLNNAEKEALPFVFDENTKDTFLLKPGKDIDGDYVNFSFDSGCVSSEEKPDRFTLKYKEPYDFSRYYAIPNIKNTKNKRINLFFPVLSISDYNPELHKIDGQIFQGIELPVDYKDCILGLNRVKVSKDILPLFILDIPSK